MQRCRIRTRLRFGERVAADLFSPRERHQEFLLLLFRSVTVNGVAIEGILHRKNHTGGGAAARDFLNHNGVRDVVKARPALGLGKRHARQTQFRCFLEKFARETPGHIQFFRQRPHFRFRELAHALLQQLLFFGKLEIHRQRLLFGKNRYEYGIRARLATLS